MSADETPIGRVRRNAASCSAGDCGGRRSNNRWGRGFIKRNAARVRSGAVASRTNGCEEESSLWNSQGLPDRCATGNPVPETPRPSLLVCGSVAASRVAGSAD